jgi:hypothetical protein
VNVVLNQFFPSAGTPPPALVGRQQYLKKSLRNFSANL